MWLSYTAFASVLHVYCPSFPSLHRESTDSLILHTWLTTHNTNKIVIMTNKQWCIPGIPLHAVPLHPMWLYYLASAFFYPLLYYNGNITLNYYSDKQTVMYTWDPPPDCATLSHVAINSVVGVKLPEEGNNSCSWPWALWRSMTLDVSL